MVDKIRLHARGALALEYEPQLGAGFDGRCCRFLGVDYAHVQERVLAGGSDEEVLDWCFGRGRKPNEEEILIWNGFMAKRGWRDEDDGSTQELESYKKASGLADRPDIFTFFDYIDADEGRIPGL